MKNFGKPKGSLKPEGWSPIAQPMSDVANIAKQVLYLVDAIQKSGVSLGLLGSIVGRNQNPHCGGDGTMSIPQWTAAKNVEKALTDLNLACTAFLQAPAQPTLRSGAAPEPRPGKPLDSIFGNDDIPF